MFLIFDQLHPWGEKNSSHVDVIYCESGGGNSGDNDNGDDSNNDDDDDDDDAVLQAATVLVAMVSKKNFGGWNCCKSRQFGDLWLANTCQAIPKKLLKILWEMFFYK